MTTITEDDLEFDFSGALSAFRFDDDALHGKNTMKRVDFIVEYTDKIHFIEIKDPDNPSASNPAAFVNKLKSGKLITDLAGKYRDSLWFHTLSGKVGKKVEYIVLLSMKVLDPAMLLAKQDSLHAALPLNHKDWTIPSASSCVILNIDQYIKRFGATSVRRVSGGAV